jgi:hypothetical protein
LATAFSTACQAGDRPLTLSVAPRSGWIREGSSVPRSQLRFRRPLVKRSAFHGAERLPPTSAPGIAFADPFSVRREPATSLVALPPRSWLPTLIRPLPLSRSRARPEAAPGAVHPWPPRAARRLPISATDTIHEHNCAIVQTPPTTPVVAHDRSFLHSTHLGSWNGARVAVLRGTANRDFTGQRPAKAFADARLPPAAIARGGGFTPTRSTRTPHVANSW